MSAPKTSKMVEFANCLLAAPVTASIQNVELEAKLKRMRKQYEERCREDHKEVSEEVWYCICKAEIDPPRWSRFIG